MVGSSGKRGSMGSAMNALGAIATGVLPMRRRRVARALPTRRGRLAGGLPMRRRRVPAALPMRRGRASAALAMRRSTRLPLTGGPWRPRRAGLGLPFAALGAAATYFLDPRNGARRRSAVAQRLRGGAASAQDTAGQATAGAGALAARAQNPQSEQRPVEDDATLARKVETEIFRGDVPRGDIVVNAEHGRVVLRGEVADPDLATSLEAEARAIPGVRDVENLLHAPGDPAPPSAPAGDAEVRDQAEKPRQRSRFARSRATAPAPGADGDPAP